MSNWGVDIYKPLELRGEVGTRIINWNLCNIDGYGWDCRGEVWNKSVRGLGPSLEDLWHWE